MGKVYYNKWAKYIIINGKVYYNKWASSIICLFPYNIIGTVYI